VFAAVMATGILSIGAHHHGYRFDQRHDSLAVAVAVAGWVAALCIHGLTTVDHCGRRRAAALSASDAATPRG
jgi:hypothetical protein